MVTRLKPYSIGAFKTGLNTALPPHLIEDTSVCDAKNMKFSLLRVEKTRGYEKFVASALTGVPHVIKEFFMRDGSSFLMVVTHTRFYFYNTATSAFVSLGTLTGVSSEPADYDTAFDRFYITNYNDYPQYWDGAAGTMTVVPALDATTATDVEGNVNAVKARLIKGFANFLVLGNTLEDSNEFPSRVRWSRYGNPDLWENTAAGAGQAGYADVGDVDAIVAMRRLKDYLVIYKEKSIWVMQYVGPPTIFVFRRVVDGIGCVSSRAVAELINGHIFFSSQGVFSFDGVSLQPVSDRINIDFFASLNRSKLRLMNALFIEDDFEILFPFVRVSESWPTQALVYNYLTGAFGMRDLPATALGSWTQSASQSWDSFPAGVTWDDVPGIWDQSSLAAEGPIQLFGDSSGFIYRMNHVDLADTANYEGYFKTKAFDFGNPNMIKRVQRIQPLISREGDIDLEVRVAALETPYDTTSFSDPIIMNLSAGGRSFLDMDVSGRYIMFQFRTANGNEHFEMTGLNIYYIERSMV